LVAAVGGGYAANPAIWNAVDGFKALGYSITSIQLSGQGNQGDPHNWYIVMSKP
jgi:hypothetical protein